MRFDLLSCLVVIVLENHYASFVPHEEQNDNKDKEKDRRHVCVRRLLTRDNNGN
jgi:hypothetical protein